ncbi:HAMP domain-containing sensor histidine kinase [Puia sp.]|jgi:signal transduction histidine kinase|uniref:ATP-binding protein n=1 Tax=Puia sp. TaxID=2045100 RepID=UPI002F4293D2
MKNFPALTGLVLLCISVIPFVSAQAQNAGEGKSLAAAGAYCDSIITHVYNAGTGVYFADDKMRKMAFHGLALVPAGDVTDSARFLYYASLGYSHENDINLDSLLRWYYSSLRLAQESRVASLIARICESLIHIEFELQEPARADSCERILAAVIDTTTDKGLLVDGYSTMGNYYKSKSYYSTAQDYILKSIALRMPLLESGSKQQRIDYAGQCYTLAQLYLNTGLPDKALEMLYQGYPYRVQSGLTELRYDCSFIQSFCRTGHRDSALYYLHHSIDTLEKHYATGKIVPAEITYANVAVAQSYMDSGRYAEALPYLDKVDTVSKRMDATFVRYEFNRMKGKYFIATGQPAKAIPLLSQALPVAVRLSREYYTDILQDMARAQKAAGNREAALQYYDRYVVALDSLTREKTSRTFADQQTRYQTNEKEQRIAVLDQDNRLKALQLDNGRNVRRLLIAGLIVTGLFTLLLFFFYRKLAITNERLADTNEQLAVTNMQLARANETKARLFGIISHDLRSPVSRIVQLLQIQKERPDLLEEATRRKHEERLRMASENVLETMEDLLLWSKSQMQHFTPQPGPVDLREVVDKEAGLLREPMEEKQLRVENNIPAGMTRVTDENFLSVMVRNLLQNATKYSVAGGSIVASSDAAGFYLTNSSAGTRAEELNRRLQSKVVDSKGGGLGLQITADLASTLGIRIFFRDDPGGTLTAVLAF